MSSTKQCGGEGRKGNTTARTSSTPLESVQRHPLLWGFEPHRRAAPLQPLTGLPATRSQKRGRGSLGQNNRLREQTSGLEFHSSQLLWPPQRLSVDSLFPGAEGLLQVLTPAALPGASVFQERGQSGRLLSLGLAQASFLILLTHFLVPRIISLPWAPENTVSSQLFADGHCPQGCSKRRLV